jgi:ATP-dependent protease HslVU (ClpYQ) peptidase subunit
MTAVVGILNKQAVAIAADSAVTIGGPNGRKFLHFQSIILLV